MTLRSKRATRTVVAASVCLSACGSSADVATQAPHVKAQSHAAPVRSHKPTTPHAASPGTQSPALAEAAPSGGKAIKLTVKRGMSVRQLKRIVSKLMGTPRHVRTSHGPGVLDSLLGRGAKAGSPAAGRGSPPAAAPSKPAQGGVLAQFLKKHPEGAGSSAP